MGLSLDATNHQHTYFEKTFPKMHNQAIHMGKPSILRAYVDAGLDLHNSIRLNPRTLTVLQQACQIYLHDFPHFSEEGSVEVIRMLVKEYGFDVEDKVFPHNSALQLAFNSRRWETAKMLMVECGADGRGILFCEDDDEWEKKVEWVKRWSKGGWDTKCLLNKERFFGLFL